MFHIQINDMIFDVNITFNINTGKIIFLYTNLTTRTQIWVENYIIQDGLRNLANELRKYYKIELKIG